MIDFLDKLGISGGIDVHINVSIGNGIEMITTDTAHNIKSYAQLPLAYNETLREIEDYAQFKECVQALFEMRNIDPKKTNVFLTLPTVWFGLKEQLPLLLDDMALTNVILGELEQNYIFKQKEATPYWFDALSQDPNSRSIFYTAIQTEAIDEIKKIFSKLGANLVSIECSLTSNLKGLYSFGIATAQMNDDNSAWSLIEINNNGFQMIEMQGKKIQKFYEEPLPLKSYDGDEAYNALDSALQIALMDSQVNSIIVVSETDLVSAELLVNRMSFSAAVSYIENNALKKEPLTEMSLNIIPQDQLKVSLTALSATSPEDLLPIQINFLVASGLKVSKNDTIELHIGSATIRLTPIKATIAATVILLCIVGPILITNIVSANIMSQKTEQNEQLQQQISELDSQLAVYEGKSKDGAFDPIKEIEKVLKNNRTKIIAYSALGESIPKHIYLTYFMTSDEGLINIKGCADSVEDVYLFFKNMKDSLVESKLRLSKLDLKTGSLDSVVNDTVSPIDDAPYVFEITNMDENQLTTLMNSLLPSNDNAQQNNNSNNNQDGNNNPPQ